MRDSNRHTTLSSNPKGNVRRFIFMNMNRIIGIVLKQIG